MSLRRWLVLIGFALLAVPGRAQTSEPAGSKGSCLDDLSARLETRLQALPDRWDRIPPPLVPVSGRSSAEVLATASGEERTLVSEWITFLAQSPPAERAALIEREIRARTLSEVDVWPPEKLTGELRTTSLEEPALYVEAWLEWAEALGRKDALLVAAGAGLEQSARRAESGSLLEIASRWAGLPSPDDAARGKAEILSQYAARLFAAGESGKALDAYGRARKLFDQAGDRRGRGNTFQGEADVLSVLGDSEKAIDDYKRARELFEQVGDRRGQGNSFNGEANVRLVMGDKQKALDGCKRARQLFEDAGDRRGQGDTFYGEAGVLSQLGANEKALDAYRHAHRLYEAAGHRLGVGLAFFGEANVLYLLSDYDKALAAYYRASELFAQVGSRHEEGDTWVGAGEVLFQLGESRKALDAYQRAHELFEQLGDRRGEGNTFRDEADVLAQMGETAKALDAYRGARKLFEQIGLTLGLGGALLGEARLQSRQGNENEAKSLASRAVAVYHKADSVDDEGSAWLVMAEAEHSSANLEPAVSAAREAVRLHAAWRFKRISETQRATEDESISAAYDILVPVLLSQARTEEALAAAEEAQPHVLLDLLAVGFKNSKAGTATDLRAERRRLESELARVETESRQATDAGRLAGLKLQRNRIDAEFGWNRYRTLAAEQDGLLTAQPLGAAGIRSVARETGPILLYYAADQELIGFLVPSDGTEVFAARIDLSRDRLTEAVQRYIHDEANPFYAERAAHQSRELWDRLLAPFAAHLPAGGPLLIVPHGPLNELPFETLLDPAGTPAFERWAVSFAPSVSTLAHARERHKEPPPEDSFLAFSSGRGLELPAAEARRRSRERGDPAQVWAAWVLVGDGR